MSVLIDSSVWIEYFRSGNNFEKVDFLIDENLVVINDLILTELTPFLRIRKQHKVNELLRTVNKLVLDLQWRELADLQYTCLVNGLNGAGLPDLIIAQNAMQHGSKIYSLDKHFAKMADIFGFDVF